MADEEIESSEMSLDEKLAIDALSADDIEAIDKALMSHSAGNWQKVAMVVVGAMYAYPDKFEEIPDFFYGQRISALIASGHLEADGDVSDMRHSEIRIARGPIEA